MPAIVRQTMGRSLARSLLTDIQTSSNEYYIGIGKSDLFNQEDTVISPIDSPFEEREFRHNLQSIKKVEGSTFVAKRVNWSSGTTYAGWDDSVDPENTTPWYVLNDAKEVYICLDHAKNLDGSPKPSMVEPNYGLLNVPYEQHFTTVDGYTWKFLYSLRPETIFQFLSSNHIPVQEAEPSLPTGDPIEDLQTTVKLGAVGGQVISASVENGGSGYTVAPTLTVIGNGVGATAVAHVSEGVVTRIEMTNYGSGYSSASFEVGGGGGYDCELRAIVTSATGIGFDPIDDLKTNAVLINIKPDGVVDDTFIVENTFRQMGVVKNPLAPDTSPFVATSAKVLPTITLVNSSPFESGKTITGAISGAVAHVDESAGSVVHYHQNESTGFQAFQVGESVSQAGVAVSGEIESLSSVNGINRFSGDVLYIENRARIRRDAEQQEDIKIVITV